MLVEINLLPRNNEKKSSVLMVVLINTCFLMLIAALLFYWGKNYDGQIQSFDQQLEMTEKLITAEQEKVKVNDNLDSMNELKNAVAWTEQYPIETVNLLRQLIALLPERGFIQHFTYTDTGLIKIQVQFDSNRDGAYFLHSLLDSKWIKDAKLLSLMAQSEVTEPDEEGENKLPNEVYIPRYSGEYEIFINIDALKRERHSKEGAPS